MINIDNNILHNFDIHMCRNVVIKDKYYKCICTCKNVIIIYISNVIIIHIYIYLNFYKEKFIPLFSTVLKHIFNILL